jgi:hypothetical protein
LPKRYYPYRSWTATVGEWKWKRINSMRTSKTYFEQIPVETVKKIAKELPETSVVQSPDEIAAPQEHWRELAKQVQEEQDPKRMTDLVTQLLGAFDERKIRRGSGSA